MHDELEPEGVEPSDGDLAHMEARLSEPQRRRVIAYWDRVTRDAYQSVAADLREVKARGQSWRPARRDTRRHLKLVQAMPATDSHRHTGRAGWQDDKEAA